MAEAKICDICNRFYKKPDFSDASQLMILREDERLILKYDVCEDCMKGMLSIVSEGMPKWLPEEKYDRVMFDWVLVKLRDPGSGEISPLPDIAEKRSDGEWYDRNDAKIIWPVEYFMDLSLVDRIFGGKDLT